MFEGFKAHYPDAEVLKPENAKYKSADYLFTTGVTADGYAVKHEAFCQITDEVPLDVPANADDFLPKAVAFCNTRLLGTLSGCMLIDGNTRKNHKQTLAQAITDMEYGGIAIDTMPPFIFLSPYLTWGGNEEAKELVPGAGNFGNLLCFENVEKSILYDKFTSAGHTLRSNQRAFDRLSRNMTRYAIAPTWMNLTRLVAGAVPAGFSRRDF